MAVTHYRGGSRISSNVAAGVADRKRPERTPLRLYLFGLVSTLWLLAVVVRIGDLQLRQAARFTKKAVEQQEGIVEIGATRGAIYDRFGEELALSTPVESIGVFPQEARIHPFAAALLSEVLEVGEASLADKLASERFQWVKRLTEPGEAERVRLLNLPGIHFEKESKRYYPKGTVASHVLGAVGIDHQGLAGLEQRFEDELRGEPGQNLVLYDALRKNYASRILKEPVPGADLVLTLDQRIQTLAERELRRTAEETKAEAGTVIVMDPQTGDLLAVASWPSFDPNERVRTRRDLERRRNYAISNLIEPGSTFKVFTLSAVLDRGLTRTDELIDCENGLMYLGRRPIRDDKQFQLLTVSQVLERSSNIGAVKLAQRLGEPLLYEYARRFGFGTSTGLPLPGEIGGLLRPVERWQSTSLASIAFGQEVGVTAMQMARAASAVANGGLLVRPRIVKEIVPASGERRSVEAEPQQRVISPQTAAAVRAMMERTVQDGTGRKAQAPGYRVGGKTGTAQKVDPETGQYSATDYIANFVGFAPVNDPSIVVVVVIDSPEGEYHGGQVAAPIFSRVASQALRFRDVPPTLPLDPGGQQRQPPPAMLAEWVNDRWEEDARHELARQAANDAVVVAASDDSPSAAARTAEEPPAAAPRRVALQVTDRKVPELRGRPVREVVSVAAALGLRVDLDGQGIARRQWPPAGTLVAPGAMIRVAFSRSTGEAAARQ